MFLSYLTPCTIRSTTNMATEQQLGLPALRSKLNEHQKAFDEVTVWVEMYPRTLKDIEDTKKRIEEYQIMLNEMGTYCEKEGIKIPKNFIQVDLSRQNGELHNLLNRLGKYENIEKAMKEMNHRLERVNTYTKAINRAIHEANSK